MMRIQSPTPAQHRVWFSTLSKCCRNVRKDVASPSSSADATPNGEERRPSLPYFEADSVRKSRRDSLKDVKSPGPSTPKDELKFLRQLNVGGGTDADKVLKNLFQYSKDFGDEDSSSTESLRPSSTEIVMNHHYNNGDGPVNDAEGTTGRVVALESDSLAQFSGSGARRDSSALPPESEEKTEIEPTYYDGQVVADDEEKKIDEKETQNRNPSCGDGADDAGGTAQFDMKALRHALASGDTRSLRHALSQNSQSFSSSSIQVSRSSSFAN